MPPCGGVPCARPVRHPAIAALPVVGHCRGEVRLHHLDAKGLRTRVLEAGMSGPVLILLHGVSGHLEAEHLNVLAHTEYFRVFVINTLGHGFTDKSDRNYEIIDCVEHLHDVIDAIGVDKAHISGEPLGGWVAARFGALSSEKVDRLAAEYCRWHDRRPQGDGAAEDAEPCRSALAGSRGDPKRLECRMLDPSIVT